MKNQIKKLELDRSLEIEMLENQLADWKKFNSQLQGNVNNRDNKIFDMAKEIYHRDCLIEGLKMDLQDYNELKEMNLFQLILWKLKQ